MTTKIKLYPASKIDARIALLHKSGQRMQNEMHRLACSVLAVVGTTKDVRVVHKFVLAMPEMARTNGLRNWFEQFAPVKFITEGEGEAQVERVIFVKDGKFKLGDAMAKPFWKFSAKEGAPYEPIDLNAYVNQKIKRLGKDIEKAPAPADTVDPRKTLIDAFKGMLAKTPAQTQQAGDPLAA